MTGDDDKKSFWTSVPGILTGLAALISAIGGIYFAIPAPVINSFEADPNSIIINDSSKLSWNVTNAQRVSIDNGVGDKSNVGSCMVSPKENITYKITARNFWVKPISRDVTIEVLTEEPPEVRTAAIFSYSPEKPKVGQKIDFDGSESKSQKYFWEFGDGNATWGEQVTHKYSEGGTYTINLTVTSNKGVNSSSKSVEVIEPLEAIFSYSPTNPNVGEEIAFDASRSRGDIADYEWNFDDGEELEEGSIINHSFSQSGIYEVELTVSSGNGEENSSSKNVDVSLKTTNYSISIHTGKDWLASLKNPTDGAGTSQEVKLSLDGTDGVVNTELLSGLEQDSMRTFRFPDEKDVGEIRSITIHFNERKTDAWKPEWITVTNEPTGRYWSFKIGKWLKQTGTFGPYYPTTSGFY